MSVHYFTTPQGEQMAVLPRAELEALSEAAEHARAVADYEAGRLPGLTPEETLQFVELAADVGIAQNYLSDIENGKRSGPVELWLRLSRSLGVHVDALVEAE
jgi:DNA-binding XRE family transcriptional regulator